MISRRTIFSLLLTILIFLGIRVWIINHHDPCQSYLPGHVLPQTVMVESGTRTVEMPCSQWLPRQPDLVQLSCLLDLTAVVVFLLSVWRDINRWRERRRKSREKS
jgi:hypothetical protein